MSVIGVGSARIDAVYNHPEGLVRLLLLAICLPAMAAAQIPLPPEPDALLLEDIRNCVEGPSDYHDALQGPANDIGLVEQAVDQLLGSTDSTERLTGALIARQLNQDDRYAAALSAAVDMANPNPAAFYFLQEYCGQRGSRGLCDQPILDRMLAQNPVSAWPYLSEAARAHSLEEREILIEAAAAQSDFSLPWSAAVADVYSALDSTIYGDRSDVYRLQRSLRFNSPLLNLDFVRGAVQESCSTTTARGTIAACADIGKALSEAAYSWTHHQFAADLLHAVHSEHPAVVPENELLAMEIQLNNQRHTLAYGHLGLCSEQPDDYVKRILEHGQLGAVRTLAKELLEAKAAVA